MNEADTKKQGSLVEAGRPGCTEASAMPARAGCAADELEPATCRAESREDPDWGHEAPPGIAPPLLNRCTLRQLEEDVGPEHLPDILGTFLAETNRRLGQLAARVGAGDTQGAADEAHALKGSASTFGAMALRQTAFDMERAGRSGELERIVRLLPTLDRLAGETCELLCAEYPFIQP
jgi:HPt (histidine-containing phosphotransfer) domain-containing protein